MPPKRPHRRPLTADAAAAGRQPQVFWLSASTAVCRHSPRHPLQKNPGPPPTSMGHSQASPSQAAWPLDLACLNGARAACSIAVVLQHCFLLWRPLLPADTAALLTRGSSLLR